MFWQMLCWILDPLLKTGAHHSYSRGCRRINEITHGKCLALDEWETLPLMFHFPSSPVQPAPAPGCLSPGPSVPLTQLERNKEGIHQP